MGEPANAFEGTVPLRLADRIVTLRLDWRASAALIQELGEDWSKHVGAMLRAIQGLEKEPVAHEKIARVVVILCQRHDPDITTEDVIDASPPMQVVADALGACWNLFYYGHPGLAEDEQGEDGKSADPLATRTRWSSFGGPLLARVFARANSGRSRASRQPNGSGLPNNATPSG